MPQEFFFYSSSSKMLSNPGGGRLLLRFFRAGRCWLFLCAVADSGPDFRPVVAVPDERGLPAVLLLSSAVAGPDFLLAPAVAGPDFLLPPAVAGPDFRLLPAAAAGSVSRWSNGSRRPPRNLRSVKYIHKNIIFLLLKIFIENYIWRRRGGGTAHTVGAESLCRCRWKVRYLRPLDF